MSENVENNENMATEGAFASNGPLVTDSQSASIEDIVSFIKNLCLTFSHLSYYPSNHPVAAEQMKKAWNELQPVFGKYGDVSISLVEGKLLFFGMPVEETNPVVSKFSRHFEELHIHSIKFKKNITVSEFITFFKHFSQDHKTIEESGGIEALIKNNKIENIIFNAAVYKVINEDEKIVKKDEIFRGETYGEEDSKTELLRYFLQKMLDKSQDEKELLDEIKNNPEGLAEQIVKIVEGIGSGGKFDRDSMVEALIQNVQMVSDTLYRGDTEKSEKQETVANAMLLLENELKRKSRGLSSRSSIRFIKRITDVVSSYTEKVKADKILDEFLKHERSLRSAEKMIKELNISGGDSGKKILDRIKVLLNEKGMKEDELINLLDENINEKTKHRRKLARDFVPLADRIKHKLDKDFKDIREKEKLLDYLNNVYTKEINRLAEEKTAKIKHELSEKNYAIQHLEELLDKTNIGIVVLGDDNNVVIAEHSKEMPFEIIINQPLPNELIKQLSGFDVNNPLKLGDCTVWQVDVDEKGTVKSFMFYF